MDELEDLQDRVAEWNGLGSHLKREWDSQDWRVKVGIWAAAVVALAVVGGLCLLT